MYKQIRYIRQQWSLVGSFFRFADALCIGCSLWMALFFTLAPAHHWPLVVGALSVAVYFLFAELSGVYRTSRGVTPEREMICAASTWGCTLLALVAVDAVLRTSFEYSRSSLLLWFALPPMMMVVSRAIVHMLLKLLRARGINTRPFAIVGINELGIDLARNIKDSPEMGLKLIGFYDDRPEERTTDLPEDVGKRIGDLEELVDQARDGLVDFIYITFPMRAEERIKSVLNKLADTTASVYVVPDFFVFELLHSRWTNINGLPVVSVFESPLFGVDGMFKRALDLALATVSLLVAAIPMTIIAILIKRSSPGPVFFRQRRYGLDGGEIKVWKFRSMRTCEDGDRVVQATANDSRVTPLGAFLRKSSLDELPQLFNVLDGSMSLVGPRPHATAHNEEYRKLIQGYMLRHKVKPGITGLAQVNGWRGETDTLEKMERRVECDHEYIRDWSLLMDVEILFRTIFTVFSRKNAY